MKRVRFAVDALDRRSHDAADDATTDATEKAYSITLAHYIYTGSFFKHMTVTVDGNALGAVARRWCVR